MDHLHVIHQILGGVNTGADLLLLSLLLMLLFFIVVFRVVVSDTIAFGIATVIVSQNWLMFLTCDF